MTSGMSTLFSYQSAYCAALVALNNLPWWKFRARKVQQEFLDYTYPLMAAEVRLLNSVKPIKP
jgi:hypothetical protein